MDPREALGHLLCAWVSVSPPVKWAIRSSADASKCGREGAYLVAQLVKNLPAMWETWVPSLGWEDPLEKGKAIHSSILAWRIPWTVEFMGSQRVGND